MSPKVHLAPEVLVPRLGEYLLDKGLITEEQLQAGLAYQKAKNCDAHPCLLGQALVELGYLERSDLDTAVTEQIISLRQALQDANRYLERRVKERTAELQEALSKLAELNRLKSNFVANISHELRTPLTHIKGYLSLLLSGSLGPLNEDQQHALEVSERSAMRLEELINDLLLFSLASKGSLALHIEPVDLSTVLAKIVPSAQMKAEHKDITLSVMAPRNLPAVLADVEKISWVFNQLLDNAIKFTERGGQVSLRISRASEKLVVVAVSDTGIGIPEEKIDAIFEPFYQLDGSSTRRYGGTGLGLSLVKEIIEAHGTLVDVSSRLGEGTTVKFYLQVDAPDSESG